MDTIATIARQRAVMATIADLISQGFACPRPTCPITPRPFVLTKEFLLGREG